MGNTGRLDIMQGGMPVNRRFARAQQVQVRTIEDKNIHAVHPLVPLYDALRSAKGELAHIVNHLAAQIALSARMGTLWRKC